MCYGFWQHQERKQQQAGIAKRVRDMLEKAKTAPPALKAPSRPATAQEKDVVPV